MLKELECSTSLDYHLVLAGRKENYRPPKMDYKDKCLGELIKELSQSNSEDDLKSFLVEASSLFQNIKTNF